MSQPLCVAEAGAFETAVPVRVEDARRKLVGVCGRFDLAVHDRGDVFDGAIGMRNFGLFDAAVVATELRAIWRDAAMIRQDPARHLFLIYQQAGQSMICQGETRTVLTPGTFHLVDPAFPSEFHYSGGLTRKISMHLPRDETLRRLGTSCVGGLPIDPGDPLSAALEALLAKIISDDCRARPQLSDMLVELLATYVRCREMEVPTLPPKDADRLERARALIRSHAAQADYDLDALCRDLGMSRRSVQRLFSAVGETASAALQEARLARARQSLLSAPELTVAEIAFEAGYNDLAHFHRSFRTRFGQSPGTYRKGVRK